MYILLSSSSLFGIIIIWHYHNFPLNFLPRLPTCLPNTWAGLANELQSTDQLPEATEVLFCFSISAFTFCILNFVSYMK